MIDDKIKKWIDDSVKSGYSIEKIKQNLVKFGYSEEEINSLTKDLKENEDFKKLVTSHKLNFSVTLKQIIAKPYFLISVVLLVVILVFVPIILTITNTKDLDITYCNPIFITLEKACRNENRVIIQIKNNGITFSEFNYYVNDQFANKEKFVFGPEKITSFFINLSMLETQESKKRFLGEVRKIKITPLSNGVECEDKAVITYDPLVSCSKINENSKIFNPQETKTNIINTTKNTEINASESQTNNTQPTQNNQSNLNNISTTKNTNLSIKNTTN